MDSGATIAGLVILLIIIIPFLRMRNSSAKKKKQMLKGLMDLASKNNCTIDQYDWWNKSSIGIDQSRQMIFFTHTVKGEDRPQQINLADIQQCRVVNASRTVTTKNGTYKLVEKLELVCSSLDKNRAEQVLEFYNSNYDSLTLSGELQLVEKWCKLLNDLISVRVKRSI